MATIFIPALLRHLCEGAEQVQVEIPVGERPTVRQVLEQLDSRFDGLLDALLYRDDLLPSVAVFIDNDQAPLGLQSRVGAQSEVHFLPPLVGGR